MPTGPPDKWAGFSTLGITTASQFADALTALWVQGYHGPMVVAVPNPNKDGTYWVAVSGYTA